MPSAASGLRELQRLQNLTVLAQRLLGATGPRARAQALQPQLVIQFVEQHPLQPFTARGAHDGEMIVLVARALIISRARRQLRLARMMPQQRAQLFQFRRGHALGGEPRRHAFKRFAHEEQLFEIRAVEIDHAHAELRCAHHQPAFEAAERFAQRSVADAEAGAQVPTRTAFVPAGTHPT